MKKLVTVTFSMVLNQTLEIDVPDKALEDNELNIIDGCQFPARRWEGRAILKSNPGLLERLTGNLAGDVDFDPGLAEIESFQLVTD